MAKMYVSPEYRGLMESYSLKYLQDYLSALEVYEKSGAKTEYAFLDMTFDDELMCIKQMILERKMLGL